MKLVLTLSVLLLSACNLSASLTGGGGQEHTFNPTYKVRGVEHTMEVIFTMEGRTVVGLTIKTGGVNSTERAKQLAIAANARQYFLRKDVDDIHLPQSIGEEVQLTGVLSEILEELKNDL
jgi:hypothetical protein